MSDGRKGQIPGQRALVVTVREDGEEDNRNIQSRRGVGGWGWAALRQGCSSNTGVIQSLVQGGSFNWTPPKFSKYKIP